MEAKKKAAKKVMKKDSPEERLKKLEALFEEIQYLLRREEEKEEWINGGDIRDAIKSLEL